MTIFREEMKGLSFSPDDKDDFNSKGETMLDKYYEKIKEWDIKKLYKAEMLIDNFEIDGEKFTVKIDRVDEDDDGGYIIYDYKTGRVRSKKDVTIDGESSHYFNQLAFYKYIFHKKEGVELNKIKTALLFTKNCSRLDVEISEQDCIAVKDEYLETIKKIREANFEKAHEENADKACKFCSCTKFCRWKMIKDEKEK